MLHMIAFRSPPRASLKKIKVYPGFFCRGLDLLQECSSCRIQIRRFLEGKNVTTLGKETKKASSCGQNNPFIGGRFMEFETGELCAPDSIVEEGGAEYILNWLYI
jgi:hypothetical protein